MAFDIQLGLELRDAAIEAVDKAAALYWKEEAIAALRRTCAKFYEFTVDDVQREIVASGAMTLEGRAMGPVMLRGVKNGWMEASGKYTKSSQSQCHGNPRTIWRSKIRMALKEENTCSRR